MNATMLDLTLFFLTLFFPQPIQGMSVAPAGQATATIPGARGIEPVAPGAAPGGKCPKGIQHNIALREVRAFVHCVLSVRAPSPRGFA